MHNNELRERITGIMLPTEVEQRLLLEIPKNDEHASDEHIDAVQSAIKAQIEVLQEALPKNEEDALIESQVSEADLSLSDDPEAQKEFAELSAEFAEEESEDEEDLLA